MTHVLYVGRFMFTANVGVYHPVHGCMIVEHGPTERAARAARHVVCLYLRGSSMNVRPIVAMDSEVYIACKIEASSKATSLVSTKRTRTVAKVNAYLS